MRYHLTPARVAITKKSTNNKRWRGFGGKGMYIGALWKTVWRFLKKLKREPPIQSSIPTGHLSRQNYNLKRYVHLNIHCSTSQVTEATQMSITRGVDKEDVVHIHNAILLSLKKE